MSIETMKLALEALENSETLINGTDDSFGLAGAMDGYYSDCFDLEKNEKLMNQAIITLRQAIEQAEKQEPVAWWCCIPGQDAVLLFDEPRDEQYPPGYKEPLYTSPPPRQPLTDEQMFELAEIAWRHGWASCRDAEYVGEEAEDERWGMVGAEVVQDIAAHGIKGEA